MSNDTLYLMIDAWLGRKRLPVSVQKRIYSYGVKSGDSSVFTRLLKVSNLDDEIDRLIMDINTVDVRAAWCVTRKRSKNLLNTILEDESRSKVILAVLTLNNLSESLTGSLVSKLSGNKVLTKIVEDSLYPDKSRLAAARRLLSKYENEYDESKLWYVGSDILQLLRGVKFSTKDISDNPVIIANIPGDFEYSHEDVDLILNHFIGDRESCRDFSKQEREALGQVFDSLLENGSFIESYAKYCYKRVVELHRSCKSPYSGCKEVSDVISSLDDIISSGLPSAYSVLSNGSKQAISKTVASLERLFRKGYSVSSETSHRYACAVISNPNSDVKDLDKVSDWFSYGSSVDINGMVKDPKKFAYYLYYFCYDNGISIINSLENRDDVLNELVKISVEEGGLPGFIEEGTWLNAERVLDLPLDMAMSSLCTDQFVSAILDKFEVLCDDESAWDAFTTLSDEFEGSGRELLNACKNL